MRSKCSLAVEVLGWLIIVSVVISVMLYCYNTGREQRLLTRQLWCMNPHTNLYEKVDYKDNYGRHNKSWETNKYHANPNCIEERVNEK